MYTGLRKDISANNRSQFIKGLKYTPTPKRNIIELKRDAVEFARKLRLIEMFSCEEKKIGNEGQIFHLSQEKLFSPTSKQRRMSGQNN